MPDKFHNANLRGFNFKGQDLTEADFTGADIRGANFTNGVLVGANFHNAKTGLSKNWTVVLGLAIFFLTFLAGLISGYGACLIANLIGDGKTGETLIFSIVFFIILIANLTVIYWRGIGTALAILAETIGGGLITAIAFFPSDEKGGLLAVGAQFTALALVGTISGIANMSIAVAIARSLMWRGALIFTSITALLGIILGVILGGANDTSYIVSSLIAITVIASGTYVGSQAIKGNRKYTLIQSIAIAAISQGGTKFRRANLTDANFTAATLKSADFRQANLTRTNWYLAKQLEQARCDRTYLEDPQIRQLAVTKDGQGKHFEHLNLHGLNLKDANLKDAFFIGADLSEATLENANLTGARLVKTQLYQANLSGTSLTGAYIENWGISTDTNLDNVKCDYIFMQLPTAADPDPCRKPDNKKENFKEGDFADFIAPIIKTLDLYHTQNLDLREVGIKFKTLDLFHYEGIDPSAAAIAIKQLIEQHPEAELEVISLEGRGNEKIRLQAKVAGDTNRSELNAEYFAKYQQIKSLPYSDMQSLLTGMEEKDERIRGLEKLLENAISQPKFYVETYHNQGEFIMAQENKGNVNISGVQGNISGIAAAGENQTMTGVAIGAISGSVTNTISQLPASSDPNTPGIKELLTQLQAAIEAESALPDEDKAEALEQVKTLAEAGTKPEDNLLQKAAKTSIKILKGTIACLPDTAKLAESCAKLIPAIASLLALI
jgi:uncharacterized protein YjbI with pentapeptide repeats